MKLTTPHDLREGIFTATFFVLGRKPLKETGIANDDNL